MRTEKFGSTSFCLLKVTLGPGEEFTAESGAMASHDPGIDIVTSTNGGFMTAFIAKFFGHESFFINTFRNVSAQPAAVFLTQSTPGDIVEKQMINESHFIEGGSFIARTEGIRVGVSWAGFSSWFAGEGLFRLRISGTGTIWYGSYGAIIEKEIVGDYIVDSGHLLSYPPTVRLKLKLSGGIFSSLFSKEGFVLQLSGSGKVLLQTRSVKGLAQWLNPRFWG